MLGVADRVVFTGFVSDEELVAFYQATSLFVFPSLYEGFGLPVVEALACGAPALVGRNSSLVELVEQPEAFLDAADPASIRDALGRALADDELLDRLRNPKIIERFTWRRIAEQTAAEYQAVTPTPRRARKRPRVLCVAPVGAAHAHSETTREVLEALANVCDVDVLIDEAEDLPPGLNPLSLHGLRRGELLRGGYDETIYWLGNSIDYALPLHLLRQRPGIVVAYDVRFAPVYAAAARARPELEPRRFRDLIRSMYPGHDSNGSEIDDGDLEKLGIYMASEAIHHSTRFFVHDPADLARARLEANPGDHDKVEPLGSSGQSSKAVAERLYSAITTPVKPEQEATI